MMGNKQVRKISYEDVQNYILHPTDHAIYMINVMPENEQHCLIPRTINAQDEVQFINKLIENKQIDKTKLILYGKNSNDPKLQVCYEKLYKLGFKDNQLFIYLGGMFEWLCLQDIFGAEEFPTTQSELDILKYKPLSVGFA